MGKGQLLKSPVGIAIVLIVLLVMLGVMSSQGGVLNEIAEELDKLFGKKNITVSNYEIAKGSTCYLVCAVDSVLSNSEQDCSSCGLIRTSPTSGFLTGTANVSDERVKCETTKKGNLRCTVKDFYLPQETTADHWWNRWVAGLYDPNFLVYWQKFPLGEDQSWTGGATWSQNVMTVAMYGFPVSLIFGKGKKFFVGKVKEIPSKVKGFFSNLIGKIFRKGAAAEGETIIVAYGKGMAKKYGELGRKTIADGVVTYQIADDIPALKASPAFKKDLELSLRYGEEGVFTKIRTFTQQAEKEFLSIPDTKKASVFSKIMGAESLNPTWSDYKRVLKLAGVAGIISAAGAIWDMRNDKFFERPNKMVLQTRTTKNDMEELNVNKDGYPIILDKKLGLFKGQVSSSLVPFYLASPCRADLSITFGEEEVPCGSYKYKISTNTVDCWARDPKGWWDKFLNGDFGKCDELPKTGAAEGKFSDEFLNREMTVINDIVSGKNITIFKKDVDIPGLTGTPKYDLITEPIIGIDFYYNPRTIAIYFIGKDGQEPINLLSEYSGIIEPNPYFDDHIFNIRIEKDKKYGKDLSIPPELFSGGVLEIIVTINKSTQELESIKIIPKLISQAEIYLLQEEGNLAVLEHNKYEHLGVGPREILESRMFLEDTKIGTNCIFEEPVIISLDNKDVYIKDPYNEEYNFCFSQPSGTAQAFFIGTMIADLIVQIYSKKPGVKFFSEVAFGLIGGTAIIHLSQDWPGKKYN